ncbi:MAG: insulinase family protein, partial [Eubacterium sp.]|nr:insulinase family protein [Eubacterium sp.]
MKIENCRNYELKEKQEIAELNSCCYLLEHKKTKAKVALIENDDNNKVFTIGFRTPPKDSTGVAHIVEHTVLCGSREFPVKDPFIELAKGSLNTFLNAMTYPDKTVYPVASCNDKDFQNLMHVYLDAVFYPNIYKEEKIFRQEGWHYELESEEAPLIYNGVVYNEMKGVFSSPDQLLLRNIQHSLFPDTSYSVESGGDPAVIPELKYEDYLAFHEKYYHPSNSYIYLYGDMDMEEKLNWIDEHYLSHFDYLEVDSHIDTQKPFTEPVEEYGFYSVTEGEDTEGKAYFSYNVVCGDSLDRELYRSLRVLDHVLVESVGAPVKQALMDAGIGSEISSVYEESIKQPWFSIVAKDVKMEQKSDFIRIIRETLEKLVREGLNEKSLRAAINGMEFQYREADFGSYPKGLMYGLQMFDSWLYDENKPFIHLKANDIFEFLKEQIGTGYFENLIQKYFLDNTHASFVSVQPMVGLTGKLEQEEREKLAAYKETLTKEQLAGLVQATKELTIYQEEPTPAEALKCIPLLTREDIEKEVKPFFNEEKVIAGRPAVHHNVFTNGINYIRLAFDIKDLKEYAPYIGLLTELISSMDTDNHDKLELSNEILLHAGSFAVNTASFENRETGDYDLQLEVFTKVLYPETEYMFRLMKEIFLTTHLEDEKRLREIVGEARSAKQTSQQAAGHTTAAWRALAYVKERMYYVEQIKGVSYYDFLCDLEENFEERKENLIA